jgi:membrane protease YdiL (CAAX protease family)
VVDPQRTASVPAKTRPAAPTSRWGLADAAIGILLAAVLALAWAALTRTVVMPAAVQVLGGALAIWVPLTATVVIASRLRGQRSLHRDFGFAFRPLDLLWGIGVGLSARAVTTFLELGAGRGGSFDGGVLTDRLDPFVLWFGLLVAPLLIGPVVEEVFFRGLVLRAVERATVARRAVAASVAVVVSALAFALLHVVLAPISPAGWVAFGGLLVLGLGTGVLAVLTGRIGGAVIAHVVYNGVVVVAVVVAGLPA